jgi:hypothetical protein
VAAPIEMELKSIGVETGADERGNRVTRLTLESITGQRVYGISRDANFTMKAVGLLTKTITDDIVNTVGALNEANRTAQRMTYTSLEFGIVGKSPGRVLMVGTTDNLVLQISLSDGQAQALRELLK